MDGFQRVIMILAISMFKVAKVFEGSDFKVFRGMVFRFSKVWIMVRLKIGLGFRKAEIGFKVETIICYDTTKMVRNFSCFKLNR